MTLHAKKEMEADDLGLDDIKMAVIRGTVSRKLTGDPRGTRYEIKGPSLEGETVHVVGRFTSLGEFRIITVFKEG